MGGHFVLRKRGLSWNSERPDAPWPTPHPFEKNGGIIFFGIFDERVWEMYPPPGTPKVLKKFPKHVQWKNKTLYRTSKPWNIFPRIEHVWENHLHWHTHTHTRTHTFSLLRGVGTVYRCLSLMYFSFFIQGHLLLLPSKQHGRSVEAESWEMKCNEGTTFIKYIFKIGRPARRPPPNLRGCPHVPPPNEHDFCTHMHQGAIPPTNLQFYKFGGRGTP